MGYDVTKTFRPYEIIEGSDGQGPILCDTHTDGGGWIVFQRRTTGDVDFYRDWTEYREGFGSMSGDFWMGNERIHQLSSEKAYELRVDLRYQGKETFAVYESFIIESEADLYKIKLGTYHGTAGNNMHNLQAFSTFDRDNDKSTFNCAISWHGAWWYEKCHRSNLNGQWGATNNRGPRWEGFSGTNPVTFSEMKIRRVPRPQVGYKIKLGTYHGTAGNNMHNLQAFSTFDRDNDKSTFNCAISWHGAWWYEKCHRSNLNGQWGATNNRGPRWEGFSGTNPVTFSEMKIRRVPRPQVG
ncbi:hypothetical protein EGW08_002377 [Elysia chlorotica]|uniref:Fibrinogen C-terminal domain-containing protein n=1 Tax=Elysia chlorotica TaxID=188477 RepID=A0A3S1I0J7_ELYCH|nr:hypothetical protein EGW08_002377 [Elysia chlorotica]